MKEELFALEKASVSCENRPVLTEINMHIYKNSRALRVIILLNMRLLLPFFPETCAITSDGCVFCGNLSIPKR